MRNRNFFTKFKISILILIIPFFVFADGMNSELLENPLVSQAVQVENSVQAEISTEEVEPSTPKDEVPSVGSKLQSDETKVPTKEYGNLSENSPLYFGNPSDALPFAESEQNYLMEKPQFSLSYNNETFCANWVAWHLSSEDIGSSGRANNFRADKELPDSWYKIKKADYQFTKYGFDRGHLCPSADRTKTVEDNEMTFLMSNMVPQSPDCNRIVWKDLEAYERDLAEQNNELYIFAGPAGTGGIGSRGQFDYIPVTLSSGEVLKINVPSYTWKVIMVLNEGEDDISRIDENTRVFAVLVPNEQGCQNERTWEDYVVTVDKIEELCGCDFFELLPDEIEDAIECRLSK